MTDALSPYTAVLIASYGGPRQPEDVLPFMRNATAGRGVPDERLVEVSQHYALFGGRSPINEQNEALRDALADELERRGCPREVVIGNRNWTPYFAETVGALRDDGHQQVVALATAAYSCYSACRQYREDLDRAMTEIPGIQLEKVGSYWASEGFLTANTDSLVAAVRALRSRIGQGALRVLFVTHSIPTVMNELSFDGSPEKRYEAQHLSVAADVARRAGVELGEDLEWELTFCSRSGSPHIPWLEPDISDRLGEISGVDGVVAAPIGFISDHMEVAFDLDTEARAAAEEAGIAYERAATVGTHPSFVTALADLLLEQAAVARGDLPRPAHPCLAAETSCCQIRTRKDPHVTPSPHAR
ncbi:MAG: ferrochelatase [Arachnia propionica]|uniref:ferrochelatase n=1 Tax=Arachnia propionica TaxID=1750 RepID=UPI002710FED1|nr:ferrochelatase [Arachnia propionica]